ncbi:MAG: CoA-binding protein [Bacteriovorax sp.]|jgi:hypothetical protein
MSSKKEKVVVYGYSDSPERYSNMAYNLLNAYHHETYKFNPREQSPADLPKACDTVSLYMSAAISDKFSGPLLKMTFKRLIVNPGAENEALEKKLSDKGVEVIHGCTLVMLKTDQF